MNSSPLSLEPNFTSFLALRKGHRRKEKTGAIHINSKLVLCLFPKLTPSKCLTQVVSVCVCSCYDHLKVPVAS